MKQIFASLFAVIGFFWGLASAFPQGGIFPSTAPNVPIMKTLDQVEPRTLIKSLPFTITVEGSYYLTGSLTGPASGNAITVTANNVTIDLKGYEIVGGGGTVGIFLSGGVTNVTVRDGTIRNFSSYGINGVGNPRVRVEYVRAQGNGVGIAIDADGAVISCQSEANVSGISGADNCLIQDSQAIANTGTSAAGITVGSSCVIRGCIAAQNAAGIVAGKNAVIEHCIAQSNTGAGGVGIGITLGDDSHIADSTSSNNAWTGFLTTTGGMSHCVGNNNGFNGLDISPGASSNGFVIDGCTFNKNGADGVHLRDNSIITRSTCNSNVDGITAEQLSTVSNCTVNSNTDTGIYAGYFTRITNNLVFSNAHDGITATENSYIDGNTVRANNIGIHATSIGAFIVRNVSTANSGGKNYVIATGNQDARVITVFGAFANTDPTANYTY